MPINPVQFAHNVCDEFLRYIFSAFPLSDPELAEQAKKLLDRPSSLDIPLVQGPFVSLSEAFAKGESVQQMANKGILHHVMPGLIGYPTMWRHQEQVFDAVKKGNHVLVATGTGSGKTESFLYPIIDDLLRQRDQGITSGLTAILVYPMNALANDQLDRLRDMLAGTGITFGQWIGTTPDKEGEVTIDRFQGSSRQAFLDARRQRHEEAQAEDRAVKLLAPPEECCSEEDIRERKPRFLLTNYRQLEVLTTRLPDVNLFANAPLKYLVFDEAHTYSGATGAEVACLIRRVRSLAGKKPDEVICVGTSATLSDPAKKEKENDDASRRFASRFFGVDPEKVAVIGESYVSRDWPTRRYRPLAPPGDGSNRLERVLAAVAEPVNLATIKAVVEELTGQFFDAGTNWRESLFEHLVSNDYVYQATQILHKPKLLGEAAWQTSQRVAMDRLPEGERATTELLAYLILGAAALKNGESLLRPKVHFFIRGLDEMVVALGGTQAAPPETEVFLSLADAKRAYPGRHDDAFFSVLTCRNCGQHFFEKHYKELDFARGAKNQLKDFEHGNAVQNDDGTANAVWATAPAGTSARVVLTNRLLEEADGGPTMKSLRWPRAHFCRQCGAMHREFSSRCLADGCGHKEPLIPLMAFGPRLSSCPSCNSPSLRIGGREIEPARKVQAVTVSDVHILAQGMINSAPEGHKKLIIFADSRQDAAFQAGWMQDHARRIRLRHMMNQVIVSSSTPLELDGITDKLMEMFRKEQALVDALLPELTGEEAPATFGHNKWVPVHKALRYMVLREFTTGVRRRDCLESMGLAKVFYVGLSESEKAVREWADTMGISPKEAVEGICLILDIWRRNRILFVSGDPIFSHYHAKDDPYIQAGLLPLKEFRPEGLLLEANSNDYARGLLAKRGASAVQALVKKWAANPNAVDVDAAVSMLWDLLTGPAKLLARVTLRSQKETPLAGDVWQVNAEKLLVEKANVRERCTTCQRITTRQAPSAACTGHHCHGETVTQEPDQENYDVWLMGHPFLMVSAEEHTAQVPGEVRAKIEQDFKSKHGKTNCLVATPTLELGVNIGALDMALMRNVPPKSANYWQRAGRAGREERMAVVITYCRRSPHDRYFFDQPLRILGGAIEAPTFNLRNPLMVGKHIRSAILSELLLRSRDPAQGERIQGVLKSTFPIFIRDYLLDADNHFRAVPTSTADLDLLLSEMKVKLADRLVMLFAQHWPADAAELANRPAIEQAIDQTPDALAAVVKRLHRRLTWARTTRADLHRKKDAGLIELEEEQLLRRCDEFIRNVVKSDRSTYTLTVLATEGFLPGYGVYEGGITASARRGFARYSGPRTFDLARSNVIALREFVPGNRLYANRGSFYVARYHLGADETARIRTLRVNPEKGYVTEESGSASYGQTGGEAIDALPLTDLDLAHESRITEDENLRFSMPVSVLGRLRKRNRGGQAYKIGTHEVSHVRGQGIELVNLGEAAKVKAGELGHWICPVCGAAKTPYAVPAEIAQFLKIHKERCGKEPIRLALSVQAEVDLLQFHDVADETKAMNIGEALRTGATRLLDMGPDDLQLLIVCKPDDKLDLLIYDPMPGGSGLLEQMLGRWSELIATAKDLLAGCKQACDTACYACLKTFRNQFHHALLNRHTALELMSDFNHGPEAYREITPVFEEAKPGEGSPSNKPEARLRRLLAEHHFPEGECRKRITTTAGLSTEPDWVFEPSKVAVYLDGMSKTLHGDPKTAQRDQLIRGMLELDGYTVIVVQSRDLDDPQAVRQHLKNIAQAIGRTDLDFDSAKAAATEATASEVTASYSEIDELLTICDVRCREFLKSWAEKSKPIPTVGFELADGDGSVVAQAELAWANKKIAVIMPDQDDQAPAFKAQGWTVIGLTDLGDADRLQKLLGE